MVASFRAGAHTGYGGGAATSITVTKPTGLAVDDFALVVLQVESGIQTITAPSGWTLKASANSGTTISVYLYWKKMVTADLSATWSFSWSTSSWRTADAIAIQGSTATDPFGGTLGTANGTGTSRTSISYTTSGAGLGFWVHSNFADSGGVTLPSGYTSRATSTDHDFRFVDRADTSGSKTTGTGTGTAVAWVAMAQTILDAAGGTDGAVTAVTATATAAGVVPTVTGGATVAAVAATATATAPLPTVTGGALVASATVTATGLTLPPTVVGEANVSGLVATATATAHAPTVSGGGANGAVSAVPATATAASVTPTVAGSAETTLVAATSTAMAQPPEVTVEASLTGGGPSSATATALPPVVIGGAAVIHVTATATAQAYAPSVQAPGSVGVVVPLIYIQAHCPIPQVGVTNPLFRFEPPTHEAPMRSAERIHRWYRLTHAASVVRVNGVLTTIHQPRPDQILAAGVEGVDWFIGGRVYDVTAEVKAELLAAGFDVG